MRPRFRHCSALLVLLCAGGAAAAHAAERVTLHSGFSLLCDHRERLDDAHVRLVLDAAAANYIDVAADTIATVEPAPIPLPHAVAAPNRNTTVLAAAATPALDTLIQRAGERRKLNVDLLRSVVQAESGGHTRAVSRAGAQGLMQLMPATARTLGVTDSFAPEQNLRGGTDYLDLLLHRYHDDLSLALAAYNAGPGAVDRYHGVPPYRETRLYVARIICEFNRRTLAQRADAQRTLAVQGIAAAQ